MLLQSPQHPSSRDSFIQVLKKRGNIARRLVVRR
jgi:hypothetical protein